MRATLCFQRAVTDIPYVIRCNQKVFSTGSLLIELQEGIPFTVGYMCYIVDALLWPGL